MVAAAARTLAGVLTLGLALTTLAPAAAAQGLAPRRSLSLGAAPGCADTPQNSAGASQTRPDIAAARQLAAQGQEAALVGDLSAAREAFARAAELNPTDDRIASDLARAHEELADTTAAITQYCRYLTMAPSGREADAVRTRLARLVPRETLLSTERAQSTFRLGLAYLDAGQYPAAVTAFTEVMNDAPTAPEGLFNRALARAGAGRRTEAVDDLELYLLRAPTAADRLDIGRAITVLRRPSFNTGTALATGLVAGGGQFYTKRPVRGVLVLGAVGGSVAAALMERSETREVDYTDPNGFPAPYLETSTSRPYLAAGIGAAAAITLAAAIEAAFFARRSRRGASILAPPNGASTSRSIHIAPFATPRTGWGLQLSARF